MSAQALRHMIERVNAHDLDGYIDGYASDVVLHGYPPGVEGREGARAFYGGLFAALPDIELREIQLMEDGTRIAAHYGIRGTHSGELLGVPATGRRVDVEGMSFFRFGEGLVAERWNLLDGVTLLAQLGALPQPG